MKLTRVLLSSVAVAVMMAAASVSANATSAAASPGAQVLGGSSSDAAPGAAATATPVTANAPAAPVPTPPGDMPPPPSAAAVKDVPAATPTPDAAALAKPAELPVPVPAPGAVVAAPGADLNTPVSGNSSTRKIIADKKSEQPDAYYDSRLNPPTGPLANSVGPRKVDPTKEPGSKYVVARENKKASDTESMLVAANRALDLDRNDAALEMFNALYQKNKRDPRILMGRAVAQQKLGQDDVAIVSYQALLDIDPKNSDAIVNMMGLLQKQYPQVALRRLKDLQEKYPANPGIAAQLGMTYAQLDDNKEAIRALGLADSLDPTNAQHAFNMAVIFDRSGDKTNAMRYYQQALQTDAVYGASRSVPREKIYDRLAKLRQ